MRNRIVFFGTPSFAAEILRFLLVNHVPIVAVVTKPDRPQGRTLKVTPCPVKESTGRIPLFQPEKASDEKFLEDLRSLRADLFVVVAYGQILSQKLLSLPRLGCINVHASLLPKYRGAAPIHRCLIAGEKETGVSIQKMVKQLDAGDVIAAAKLAISLEMTFGELEKKLCELSKPLLLSVLQEYEKGFPPAKAQDESLATYASKIELQEGEIDWSMSAEKIHNLIRAFSPRPGAWCRVQSGSEIKRLKILRSRPISQFDVPGKLLSPQGIVACGEGALQLLEVQPEGKKIMSGADWLRGCPTAPKFLGTFSS